MSDYGSSTSKSLAAQLARIHLYDWIILLLLVGIDLGLNAIEPFHRFVGSGMMNTIMYPMKDNTVPIWAVPIVAVLLPFSFFLVFFFIRRDTYDLHQATLGTMTGLLYSVLITGVLTDSIKVAIGRPRPNFFWRCFPDGKAIFDRVTGDVACTGNKQIIKEGYKSFPSGHTSWTFAGLVYFSLYISGKVRAFDRKGHAAKLCLVFCPILLAALVGISRIDDYWHHWQDVVTGAFLGLVVASFCYLQFFPPPYEEDGWGPHLYFHMLVQPQRSIESSNMDTQIAILPPATQHTATEIDHVRP